MDEFMERHYTQAMSPLGQPFVYRNWRRIAATNDLDSGIGKGFSVLQIAFLKKALLPPNQRLAGDRTSDARYSCGSDAEIPYSSPVIPLFLKAKLRILGKNSTI
jgi:hypothetical protein